MPEPAAPKNKLEAVLASGTPVGAIDVSIGPRFLELFSDHLYSSPNKAFEEIVANSWDAGATDVYISMPDDLSKADATVWILDNGESMDATGLEQLWVVADSDKRRKASPKRRQIGKFGIGKLATYLIADELTYVCKASDGVVRTVTMDYRRIDSIGGARLNVTPLKLDIRKVTDAELNAILQACDPTGTLAKMIASGVPKGPPSEGYADEFGGDEGSVAGASSGTWTLVVLSSLKEAGRAMQPGQIRRLLRTALPLGSSMSVSFNNDALPLVQGGRLDREGVEDRHRPRNWAP